MAQIISLSQMRDVDIRTVDRDTLVDIRDTKVNSALSITDRVIDFIQNKESYLALPFTIQPKIDYLFCLMQNCRKT